MTTTIDNEQKTLNVPNLRFPEFEGEWEKTTFGNIATGFDYGMNAAAKSYDGENKYIRITDINESSSTYDDKDIVSPDGTLSDNYQVKERDILLARTGASTGKTYLYRKSDGKLYYAGFLIRANVTTHNPYFVFSQLHTHRYWRWVSIMSARSGQPGINSQEYSSFPVFTTSIQEENKIAKLLSLLDERISTQNKIIEDLKKLKSAIIEWHYGQVEKQNVCIGDLGEPFNVGNLAKEDLTETGIPCVIYGELFTTYGETISQIESHTNKVEGMILSKKGDLLFPSSTTVDAMSLIAPSVINVDGVILGGDMFGIHITPNSNAQYLSYYFNHIAKRQLAKFAKGSTIIHLHYADIEKAKLLLPSLEEQNRMANCLISLDTKINIESIFISLLNSQKAYLLRQMFI